MTESEIIAELRKIAIAEIGKKHVESVVVTADADFDFGEALEILVVLKPDAPSVSGDIYISILLKARDFLRSINDGRRPTLGLDRAHGAHTTAK